MVFFSGAVDVPPFATGTDVEYSVAVSEIMLSTPADLDPSSIILSNLLPAKKPTTIMAMHPIITNGITGTRDVFFCSAL